MKYFISCLFVLFYVCVGCGGSGDRLSDTLSVMQSSPVNISFKEMSCWINDSLIDKRPWEQAKIKLVVYYDSTKCSECTLKQMYLWEDFVKLEEKYDNGFCVFFIFQKKVKESSKHLASFFHLSELNHPIYIDSKNVFEKMNTHIPLSDSKFQIFLLDKKNNVLFVGNPLFDFNIEERMLYLINKELS